MALFHPLTVTVGEILPILGAISRRFGCAGGTVKMMVSFLQEHHFEGSSGPNRSPAYPFAHNHLNVLLGN